MSWLAIAVGLAIVALRVRFRCSRKVAVYRGGGAFRSGRGVLPAVRSEDAHRSLLTDLDARRARACESRNVPPGNDPTSPGLIVARIPVGARPGIRGDEAADGPVMTTEIAKAEPRYVTRPSRRRTRRTARPTSRAPISFGSRF